MLYSEFEKNFDRLKSTYGEKMFPDERRAMIWKRYERINKNEFSMSIDLIILKMPPAHLIIDFLDDSFRNDCGNGFSARPENIGYSINPDAKKLAEFYGPSIKESIKKIGRDLPYSKNAREYE